MKKYIVLTSAFHMTRSVYIAIKLGIQPYAIRMPVPPKEKQMGIRTREGKAFVKTWFTVCVKPMLKGFLKRIHCWNVLLYFRYDHINEIARKIHNVKMISDKDKNAVKSSIKIKRLHDEMEIPLFLQTDVRWRDIPFGNGTIHSSGCGAVALAMVLTYICEEEIYPTEVAERISTRYYTPKGLSWDVFKEMGAVYNCCVEEVEVSAEKIVDCLQRKHPVILSTSGIGTTRKFTKTGHFIVLRGLDQDGNILVNDPNDKIMTKRYYKQAFKPQFIVDECKVNGKPNKMWVFCKMKKEATIR